MPEFKYYLLFSLLLVAIPVAVYADGDNPRKTASFEAKRIAHAGGGLGKSTYTNSYEALNANIAKGFEYFEIDFVFTNDGHLVCLHDWGQNFKQTFAFAVETSLSLDEFERLASDNGKFTNCTLEGLANWMRDNPSARIVTDVKDDNIKALQLINQVLPNANRRVIPQIYYPRQFVQVKAMGFEQIIWTLYRLRATDQQVLTWVAKWPPPIAVTMPKERANSALPGLLRAKGIPSYAHTVNSADEMNHLMDQIGLSEIYTDFLAPE